MTSSSSHALGMADEQIKTSKDGEFMALPRIDDNYADVRFEEEDLVWI